MQQREKTGIISSLSRINGFPRQEIFILRTAAFVPRVMSIAEKASLMFRGWAQREESVDAEPASPQPNPADLFAELCQSTRIRGPPSHEKHA
jgi:hypothetical protein